MKRSDDEPLVDVFICQLSDHEIMPGFPESCHKCGNEKGLVVLDCVPVLGKTSAKNNERPAQIATNGAGFMIEMECFECGSTTQIVYANHGGSVFRCRRAI